jgi:hypothetical protein
MEKISDLQRFIHIWGCKSALNYRRPKFIPVYQIYTPPGRFSCNCEAKNILHLIRQILICWFVGKKPFQPAFIACFAVNENGSGYMHRGNQSKAFLDSTLMEAGLYMRGDIHKPAPCWDVEPKFLAVGYYSFLSRAKMKMIFGQIIWGIGLCVWQYILSIHD